jgi:MFS family permease
VLALGATQTLAWGSTYYLPAILAIPMARELGLSPSWVFGAFSAALVLAALFGPVAGRRIDRYGGRHVLAASSLIFALGPASSALAQGPGTMLAGWLIIGMGMSMGLYEGAFSTLAGIYGRDARGAIIGVTLMAGFASTICWPLTAYMEAQLGWRAACLIWAGVHLFAGLPVNRFLLPRVVQPPPPPRALHTTGSTALDRSLILIAFVFAVAGSRARPWRRTCPACSRTPGSRRPAVAIAALVGPAQVAARLFDYLVLRTSIRWSGQQAGHPGAPGGRTGHPGPGCTRGGVLHPAARRGPRDPVHRQGHAAARHLRAAGLRPSHGPVDGAGPLRPGGRALRVRAAHRAFRHLGCWLWISASAGRDRVRRALVRGHRGPAGSPPECRCADAMAPAAAMGCCTIC